MTLSLIRSPQYVSSRHQGSVVTIGNFDGIHLGHQLLIETIVSKAQTKSVPAMVITFEPHPLEFFANPNKVLPRLSNLREKLYFFSQYAIDYVLILPFNQRLVELSATKFVQTMLYDKLHPIEVVTGEDFRFGNKREGDVGFLSNLGQSFGFNVTAIPDLMVENERISSTRIRQALAQGDHSLVNRLLGHRYTMVGQIKRGDQLGRQLGYPTANIFLQRKFTPVHGIYTVLMHLDNQILPGVANVGTRPTVDGTRTLLEVHLLDFDQNIYGKMVRVEFCKKLRDEVRYSNLSLLQAQIADDVLVARHYFKEQGL